MTCTCSNWNPANSKFSSCWISSTGIGSSTGSSGSPKIEMTWFPCMNLTFWCKVEGTASMAWIHGLPSSRLKEAGMSSTWNWSLNRTGPAVNSKAGMPITSRLVLSYALMACPKTAKDFCGYPKQVAVLNGHTFRADPLSTRTIGTLFPVVITVMCKALLWFSFGRSLSVKVIVFAIRMWEIIWTSWDGEVSNDTCVWPCILRTGSRWLLDAMRRPYMEMFAWVFFNCLITSLSSSATWDSFLASVSAVGLSDLRCAGLNTERDSYSLRLLTKLLINKQRQPCSLTPFPTNDTLFQDLPFGEIKEISSVVSK